MKRFLGAVFAAFMFSTSASPAAAQAGTGLGLIVHASIVSKCQNRQLTQEEAQRTMIFPFTGIWQAIRDCRTANAKKQGFPRQSRR